MPKKWVLVVDDDPSIAMIVSDALEHPELSVTTANDALQAFIQARDLRPIVIVSDMQMPGYGDGSTILKRLREDPRIPRMPIVFMTGMDLAKARELLPKNDPLVGLMPKPVDLDMLRDYVWKLAGVDAPPAPSGGTP
ncbi:MAG: response regulator [Elusimicrobiota bacterium]